MTSRIYVVVIADVVGSRELPPARRARLQAAIRTELSAWNRRAAWRPFLAARFAVTSGDEIQGLLTSNAPLWSITHALRAALPEVDWTIACGRGPIATALAPTAPEIDGPCFHAARAALEQAKRKRLVLAFGEFPDERLAPLTAWYSALYWSWTQRQRRAAHRWRSPAGGGWAPADRIVPSALSHLRRRMAWPLVETGDRMLRAILEPS
jgi:SatD family protein